MDGVRRELRTPVPYAMAVAMALAASVAGLPVWVAVLVGVFSLIVAIGATVVLARERTTAAAAAIGTLASTAAVPVPVPVPVAAASWPEPAGTFRRTGEYWSLRFRSATLTMKDSKGLRYLHELLARPGCEVHVTELVLADAGPGAGVGAGPVAEAGLHAQRGSGAGPLLDAQAKAAYRRRLEDLRDTIEEARAWNDGERAAQAEAEMDALAHELARAVGLGGQDRHAASEAERLRVNVTRAIRSAIERIAEHDAPLAEYFTATVRTGRFCSYAPGPSDTTRWSL